MVGNIVNYECTAVVHGFSPYIVSGSQNLITDQQARADALRKDVFASTLSWLEDEGADEYIGGSGNRVVCSAHYRPSESPSTR